MPVIIRDLTKTAGPNARQQPPGAFPSFDSRQVAVPNRQIRTFNCKQESECVFSICACRRIFEKLPHSSCSHLPPSSLWKNQSSCKGPHWAGCQSVSFSDSFKGYVNGLFPTHPVLSERIIT